MGHQSITTLTALLRIEHTQNSHSEYAFEQGLRILERSDFTQYSTVLQKKRAILKFLEAHRYGGQDLDIFLALALAFASLELDELAQAYLDLAQFIAPNNTLLVAFVPRFQECIFNTGLHGTSPPVLRWCADEEAKFLASLNNFLVFGLQESLHGFPPTPAPKTQIVLDLKHLLKVNHIYYQLVKFHLPLFQPHSKIERFLQALNQLITQIAKAYRLSQRMLQLRHTLECRLLQTQTLRRKILDQGYLCARFDQAMQVLNEHTQLMANELDALTVEGHTLLELAPVFASLISELNALGRIGKVLKQAKLTSEI